MACYRTVLDIFKNNPYIDEIITLPEKNYLSVEEAIKDSISLIYNELWIKNKFILHAFYLQYSAQNQLPYLFNYLTGAKNRIAYNENDYFELPGEMSIFVTFSVPCPKSIVHTVDRHYYLFEQYVQQKFDHNIYTYSSIDVVKKVKQYLSKDKINVIINIGGSLQCKKYPVKKLNKILAQIKENLLIIGGSKELEDSQHITYGTNLVNKLTLEETITLISMCDLYIGNDSGMVHVAAANKVPCVVLYCESEAKENVFPGRLSAYKQFYPWKTKFIALRPKYSLSPCSYTTMIYGGCKIHDKSHCIRQIKEEDVLLAYRKINLMKY